MEAATGRKSSRERFLKNSSEGREIRLQVKYVIASFRCYDNSDVIVTLIILNKFSSLSNTALVVVVARGSRAVTAKECTKKRDAREELLFCQSKPIAFYRSS